MKSRLLKSLFDRPVVAVVVGLLFVLSPTVDSQAPSSTNAAKPTFDVASITQNKSGEEKSRMGFQPGGRFSATNVTLRELIRIAFATSNPLYEFQIVGGPNWLASDRFDIEARADSSASDPDRRQRLRALLEERFRLIARPETRQLPVFALVMGRDDKKFGTRLRASQIDCTQPGNFAPIPPARQGQACGFSVKEGSLTARGIEMARIAQALGNFWGVGRPVLEKTGLVGRFDLDLEWSPLKEFAPAASTPAGGQITQPADVNATTLFTAVQEQLGLKLEPTTGPVDVFVVDRAERPTPN